MGPAFIPLYPLGNVKTVKSLCSVLEVSFHVQPQYPDGLSVSSEACKADQRLCFRGRPTPCLLDERMRSMIERAFVGTMKGGFSGSLEKRSRNEKGT